MLVLIDTPSAPTPAMLVLIAVLASTVVQPHDTPSAPTPAGNARIDCVACVDCGFHGSRRIKVIIELSLPGVTMAHVREPADNKMQAAFCKMVEISFSAVDCAKKLN